MLLLQNLSTQQKKQTLHSNNCVVREREREKEMRHVREERRKTCQGRENGDM